MKYVTSPATLSFIVMLGGPANAKSVWDQLAESAPRTDKPFVEIDMTAPRSVFTDLADTALHADTLLPSVSGAE